MTLAAARLVVPACVTLVLGAVAVNFAHARQAGPVERVTRSPVATATMLAFFFAVWVTIRLRVGTIQFESAPLGAAVAVAGAGLVLAGAIVNVRGRLELGRNWADHVTVYRAQTLVTTGAYAHVRHPLYASLVWMSCGAAAAYHNWAALAATLAVFLPAMHYRAAQEEALLERRFPGYAAYRTRVARFFPRSLRGYRDDRV